MGTRAKKKTATVVDRRIADENNAVLSVVGGGDDYMKSPCKQCPWRREHAGSFPAEAFRLSACTAEDASMRKFACHMSGSEHPNTCAGFLLSLSADDNIAVRLAHAKGTMLDVESGDADLFDTYAKMAIANGVPPEDPAIQGCMPEARERFFSNRYRERTEED